MGKSKSAQPATLSQPKPQDAQITALRGEVTRLEHLAQEAAQQHQAAAAEVVRAMDAYDLARRGPNSADAWQDFQHAQDISDARVRARADAEHAFSDARHTLQSAERTARQTTSAVPSVNGARVDVADEYALSDLEHLTGHVLTDGQIAALVGARSGDTVTLASSRHYRDRVEFTLNSADNAYGGQDYHAERYLQRGDDYGNDVLFMHNSLFEVAPSEHRQGLGTSIFAREVHALAALGVEAITTNAARSPSFNGYYTWARLGYNADLTPAQRGDLPASLRGARDIQTLMGTPEGRDWWREHGTTFDGTFDLTPGSRSRAILDAYVKARGITI